MTKLRQPIAFGLAKSWLDALLAFIYPEICQICREARANLNQGYVCRGCQDGPGGIRWIAPPTCWRCGLPFDGAISTEFACANCARQALAFDRARAAVVATPLLLNVVHRYKYGQAIWFESFLGNLLLHRAVPAIHRKDWDFIVPIPLHPLKLRERGFNQAEQLAALLSGATGIPMMTTLVHRTQATPTQTHLSRRKRFENVCRAFAPRPRSKIPGARAIVIDDILTTGATASGCARALRQAGASKVSVWTVARGA